MPHLLTCVALRFANHVTDNRGIATSSFRCLYMSTAFKEDHPYYESIPGRIGMSVGRIQKCRLRITNSSFVMEISSADFVSLAF